MTGPHDRASLRDDEVLRCIYTDNAAVLKAFVRRFTTDAQADDIVQETFIRAWQHLDRLRSDDRPVRPWLIQVARHLLTDAARRDRRRPTTTLDEPTLATAGVDGGLDQVLDQQILRDALQHLSDGQRAVLIESWFYGESVESAAGHLGIPAGTARSRLYYARRSLRADLATAERVA